MSEAGTDQSESVTQLLEEESAEEEQYRLANQNSAYLQPGAAIGLVHSPTTDTLDSVLLDPPSTYQFEDLCDGAVDNSREISPSETERNNNFDADNSVNVDALVADVKNIDLNDVTFSFEGHEDIATKQGQAVTQPSLSSYFGADPNVTANETNFFDTITTQEPVDFNTATKVACGENLPMTAEVLNLQESKNLPNIENLEKKDVTLSNQGLDLELTDIEFNETEGTNDENFESLDQFESIENTQGEENYKDGEDVDIESVNFDMDLSGDVEETAPPVDIQEKDEEDFESFTADLADLETMDALGMSPAAPSYMTERNIHDYFRQTSQTDSVKSLHLNRHSSGSSGISSASQDVTGFPSMPLRPASTVEEETSKVITSQDNTSEVATSSVPSSESKVTGTQSSQPDTVDPPSHQPMFPASTTQLILGDSPVHCPTPGAIGEHTHEHADIKPASLPCTPEHIGSSCLAPFQSFADSGGLDDPFSVSVQLQMSDSDRCHDAWLPSEATKNSLITIATSPPGTFTPNKDLLCSPSLVVTDPMGDPVRDLVYRYMGEQEALKRQVLTADSVPPDVDGLKQLIASGCWRSAVDLTVKLLSGYKDAIHSTDSLQLWHCRFSLLMKLRMHNIVESEMQAFQTLDTPDMYYEYYPEHYPGKRGCMVPFGMRLLHAELPQYMGRSQESLDRYYYILAICHKILRNLTDGVSEDGSAITISVESRQVSQELWTAREKQVLYCIANTLVSIRDYDAALTVYETLLVKDVDHRTALLSGMGRIHLQMGNLPAASDYFQQVATTVLDDQGSAVVSTRLMNRGFESMCQNNFTEAYQNFKNAVQVEPANTSAVNNMAVCCLYLGKLKEALKSLETLVHSKPDKNLHEGILFNLCTLYELESSRALHKKQALLDLVSKHKGDGFPVACLKMA